MSNSEIKLKQFCNLKELAIILGRSENSIRFHIKKGRITPQAKFGRSYSFQPEEVIKQLQRDLKYK